MPKEVGVIGLVALLVVSVVVRLLVIGADGHWGDVSVTSGWAERMAEVGPWRFYEGSSSIYPALLYPLWVLGTDLDGEALAWSVKGLSIPFDLAIGLLLFVIANRRAGAAVALAASAAYLLNPATLLAGPIWGQVDAAGTLPYLGALVALAAGRHGTAGGLAALATLVKPQFGLVVLPVVVVAALRSWRDRDAEPLWRTVVGGLVGYAIVAVPLALHPLRYLSLLADTATRQPQTSLNAFNPWGLLVGFDLPDDPYVGLGTFLLLLGCVGALLGFRRRPDLAVTLAVGAALVLAFYFLPTRVHERYLFPALALLAPFAAVGWGPAAAYAALSAGFAASLLYALHQTTPFDLPEPWVGWITGDVGVWAIGVALIGSAAWWSWLLVVRRPQLPGQELDRPA